MGASSAAGSAIGLCMVTAVASAVQQAPGPARIVAVPDEVTALPLDAIGALMGRDVSKIIGRRPGRDG